MLNRLTWVIFMLAAAAPAGCFNPDYGDGGFLCKKGQCPEGYECIAEGTVLNCRPTASGPPPCGVSQRITDRLYVPDSTSVPRNFALLMDGKDRPNVFFIKDDHKIMVAERPGDAWQSKQISSTATSTGEMVAAARFKEKLVVVFARYNTPNAYPLYTSYDLEASNAEWTLLQPVSDGLTSLKITSMDMAGHADRIYLGVTTQASGALGKSGAQTLEYAGQKFDSVCSLDAGAAPYVGARVGAGRPGLVFSAFEEATLLDKRQWHIQKMEIGKSCTRTTQGIVGLQFQMPLPMAVALEEGGEVHMALPLPKALKTLDLAYHVWNGTNGTPPNPKETLVSSKLVPTSVDLAVTSKPDDVIISYRHTDGTIHGVAFQRRSKSWRVPVDVDKAAEGHSTQVAVDSKQIIHVVYDKTTKSGAELYYRCFE